MQHLLFLLVHPVSTHFSAAAPFFNKLNSIFGMGKKAAGRQVLCTHRRVTPALGARLLRSYVPLRYGPSESGCANNTCLPADTLPVRKFEFISQVLTAVLSDTPSPPILSAVHPVSLHWWTMCCGAVRWRRDGSARGVCRKLLP